MRVTVHDAASLLSTTTEQIYEWIESEDLPAYKINDQYQINRSELLEWATARKLPVSPELFTDDDEDQIPTVAESLQRGGIFYGVTGLTREDILRNVVHALPVNNDGDREMLLHLLLARESIGSTSVGDGIAIPHVRNPIVLETDEPLLSLYFIQPPVDFSAIDGKPIYALFVMICPTIHVHLHMLARLAHLLRQPDFRNCIPSMAPKEEIIAIAKHLEEQK
jgi:PTS system nitrogen regulatory IIA component